MNVKMIKIWLKIDKRDGVTKPGIKTFQAEYLPAVSRVDGCEEACTRDARYLTACFSESRHLIIQPG